MSKMEVEVAGIPGKIADQIRELISRGVLSPGMHLGQSQLAERFDASRVPVREALKLLVSEGLITHDPNRGFFVAEVSSAEARQLYRMRHLLESEILSTIEWPDEDKLSELVGLLKEIEQFLDSGDRHTWANRRRDFNNAVFELSPNKTIIAEAQRLWVMSGRYRSLLPYSVLSHYQVPEEHPFIKALKSRNQDALLRAFSESRSRVENILLDTLKDRGV
jgi:DNA-binding GntR family transcriptional regulator